MAARTAVLEDDRGNLIGSCQVNDRLRLIVHEDRMFIATERGKRLGGGGIGVIYEEVDPAIRMKLKPI